MRDLGAAASGTKDRKHLSTIWFNRGLLHEKRGDATIDSLTDAKTEPELPTIVSTRTSDQEVAYVVWRARGTLIATPIGLAWRGRCTGSLEFAIEDSTDRLVHVTGAEEAMGGHAYMCEGKADEIIECTGADDEVPAGTACLGGSMVIRDLVVDLATGRTVIAVEQLDTGTPRPKIVLTDNALTIRGQNCARTEAL